MRSAPGCGCNHDVTTRQALFQLARYYYPRLLSPPVVALRRQIGRTPAKGVRLKSDIQRVQKARRGSLVLWSDAALPQGSGCFHKTGLTDRLDHSATAHAKPLLALPIAFYLPLRKYCNPSFLVSSR